ncbi:MAG: hypothetical protein F6K16_36895, partial [Symploca sp. SIO2B6]|nr:hypothetical protein [Symploca sp. SIO2B6]
MAIVDDLRQRWESRIQSDCPKQPPQAVAGIIAWLLGDDCDRFEEMPLSQLNIAKQAMDYRYRILIQRYL